MQQLKQNAFTLLEVMVALVIVSIALMALLSAGIEYTRQQNNIKVTTLAVWLAHDCITKTRLGLINLSGDVTEANGLADSMNLHFKWTVKRVTTPDKHTDRLKVSVHEQSSNIGTELTGFIVNQI